MKASCDICGQQRSAQDSETIPVLEYDSSVCVTMFQRSLFHITYIVPREQDTRWNIICVTFSRIEKGATGWINVHLPYISLGNGVE